MSSSRPTTPTSSSVATATGWTRSSAGTAAPTTCTPTSRPAQHVRVDRVPQAGAALPRQPAQQRLAIAESLRITADDRAATSLPLHYCYGLSVVNSHLARGAGLVLTEDSVVDESFWELFGRAGATVRRGAVHLRPPRPLRFARRDLPTLRMVTQAERLYCPRAGPAVSSWAAAPTGTSW